MSEQSMPFVDGKRLRCECGCNVFTKNGNVYTCNVCRNQYEGTPVGRSADTPMTAPTTGADELPERFTLTITREQLPLLNDCIFQGVANAEPGEELMAMDGFRIAIHQQLHNQPATAELAASVKRLKEISEYASAVLILEGDFGRSTAETKRLTALLDARTLPHDWERTDAWLAQQEGRDEC